jgi:hypothetical protein
MVCFGVLPPRLHQSVHNVKWNNRIICSTNTSFVRAASFDVAQLRLSGLQMRRKTCLNASVVIRNEERTVLLQRVLFSFFINYNECFMA